MFIDKAAPNKQDAHCPAVLATPCICTQKHAAAWLLSTQPKPACYQVAAFSPLHLAHGFLCEAAACLLLPGQALSQQQLAALCHSLLQG